MQTDTIFAHALENNDFLAADTERGYDQAYVYSIEDEDDWIAVDTVDDEGDHFIIRFAPFDPVRIITSFEDESD